MTVACDVDGVVADLHTAWLAAYNDDYNDDLQPRDITGWELHNFVKPECGTLIYSYLDRPSLYDDVRPVPGARAGIAAIRNMGHRVVFVTSTVIAQNGRKLRWLHENDFLDLDHGRQSKDYVEAADKSLIYAGVLIDDYTENLRRFEKHGVGYGIVFDQPWNRGIVDCDRANTWSEVVDMLRRTVYN